MTFVLESRPGAFVGCPGDADDWAERLLDVYRGLCVPGELAKVYYWRKDFDSHGANAAVGSQYQIAQTSHPDVNPVFILFCGSIGTPLKAPPSGWGEMRAWLDANGFEYIALLFEGDFQDPDKVPEGKVPMTGTLYELLDAMRSRVSGVDTDLKIFKLPRKTARDEAERAHFARQGPWQDRVLGDIAKSYSVIRIDGESDFEAISTKALRSALGLPTLDPLTDPLPGLEALSGKLGSLLFGRSELISQLNQRIFAEGASLSLIVGVSGTGKSSLLRAGLIEAWYRKSPQGEGLRRKASALLFEPQPLLLGKEGSDPLESLMAFASGKATTQDSTLIGPFPDPFVRSDAPVIPQVRGDLNADLSSLLDWWQASVLPGPGPLVLIVDQAEQIEAIAKAQARKRADDTGEDLQAHYLSPAWLRFTGLLALLSGHACPDLIDAAVIERADSLRRDHRPVQVMLGLHRLSALDLWPIANLPDEVVVSPLSRKEEWRDLIKGTFQTYGLGLDPTLLQGMAIEAAGLADPVQVSKVRSDPNDQYARASVLPQVVIAVQRMMTRWRLEHAARPAAQENMHLNATDFGDISHIDGAINALGEEAWLAARLALAESSGLSLQGLLGPRQVEEEQSRRLSRLLGALIDADIGRDGPDRLELSYLAVESDLARREPILIDSLRNDRLLTRIEGQYLRLHLRLPHRSILTYWKRAGAWYQDIAAPKLRLKGLLKEEYRTSQRRPVKAQDWLAPDLDAYIDLALDWMGSGEGGDGELLAFLDRSLVEVFDPKASGRWAERALDRLIFKAIAAGRENLAVELVSRCLQASALTFTQQTKICVGASEAGLASVLARLIESLPGESKIALVNAVDAASGAFPLLMAAQNGFTDCVKLLLDAGADANLINPNSGTFPLLLAAQNGYPDCVKLLLDAGADANLLDPNYATFPLLLAAQNGHLDCVKLLLDAGADSNLINPNYGTFPLWRAAQEGHTDCVKLLLDAGADANLIDPKDGTFPLLMAAHNGRPDCVNLLLDAGADANQISPKDGSFPLLQAAQNGHTDCLKLLLDAVVDANLININSGIFPLLQAAQEGHPDCVRLLLDAGADANLINPNSGTFPLLMAAENGHSDCVKLLLDAGANANLINPNNGNFPLLMAAQQRHPDCVRLLLDGGADANLINPNSGIFPLLMAARHGHTDCVKLLLDAGADANLVNPNNGNFPLLMAAQDGHMGCVKLLLDAGADANLFIPNEGAFPVLMAAQNGHTECVKLLLDAGANANLIIPNSGNFPLLMAANGGYPDCVKLLLDAGADANLINPNSGTFPLLMVAQNGYPECVKLLLDAGADANLINPNNGPFPLLMAAKNGHGDCVKLLLDAGADANLINPNNGTFPLLMAAHQGHMDCVKLLLDAGADANLINPKDTTFPLLMAELMGHEEIKALLLAFGADPAMLNSDHVRAIIKQVRELQAGQQATLQNSEGRTAHNSPKPSTVPEGAVPGDWQPITEPDTAHLPGGLQVIAAWSLSLHDRPSESLVLWRYLLRARLDEQTTGLLEAYWYEINGLPLEPFIALPDMLEKLCNDRFRFDFQDAEVRKTLAALALLDLALGRLPLAEHAPLPLPPGKEAPASGWSEAFSRTWRIFSSPLGPIVQVPWIEGKEWVVGKVLIPYSGRGVRVLDEKTVICSSDQWIVPQILRDQEGQVYRLLGRMDDD